MFDSALPPATIRVLVWQAYKDGELACMFYPNWQDFVVIDQAPDTVGKWRDEEPPRQGRRPVQNGCLLVIPLSSPLRNATSRLGSHYMKFTEKATVAHMREFSERSCPTSLVRGKADFPRGAG